MANSIVSSFGEGNGLFVKKISDAEREQIIYSTIIREDNKTALLVIGRK